MFAHLIVKDSEKTNRHEKGAGLLELSEKIILKRLSDNIVQNIISLEEVDSQGNIMEAITTRLYEGQLCINQVAPTWMLGANHIRNGTHLEIPTTLPCGGWKRLFHLL